MHSREKMNYPKVLVLSNEGFSYESSNGRTVGSYFLHWPKDRLCQFYTNASRLDMIDCSYFHINESDLLRSLPRFKQAGSVASVGQIDARGDMRAKVRRTPLTMLIRDLIWKMTRPSQRRFFQWARNFGPDIVLVQIGNAPYMFRLAELISKKTDAKIVIFSTEYYYFLRINYVTWGRKGVLFRLYKSRYDRHFRRLAKRAVTGIYNTPLLRDSVQSEIGGKNEVLFNSTFLVPSKKRSYEKTVVYAGHLLLDRGKTLLEIARALQAHWPGWKLIVYGDADDAIANQFVQEGIVYNGEVPYEQILSVYEKAGILLHVEALKDGNKAEFLKYAFSTKIPDLLALGKPFLCCAPAGCATSLYLRENNAAFLCSTNEEIDAFFASHNYQELLESSLIANALSLAANNHDPKANEEKMRSILDAVAAPQNEQS